ncbi:MAG: DUF1858 domain-containing protein [Anaerovoracaceae bacterium]|nr:DUF1858 domain-containing protein [Bacillota bacterium]MDY3954999.1 DUF1858 domain-containing protein [Anaerovoracaceae bacterium]
MITKDMRIDEILQINEAFTEVLFNSGMPCVGCPGAASETLEEAADSHGIDLEKLLADLNAEQ